MAQSLKSLRHLHQSPLQAWLLPGTAACRHTGLPQRTLPLGAVMRGKSAPQLASVPSNVQQQRQAPSAPCSLHSMWRAVSSSARCQAPDQELQESRPGRRSSFSFPHNTPYGKELQLLQHVLDTAQPGDPASVCIAIEEFGNNVVGPANAWLKIAGDQKSDVLTASVSRARPGGSILEIGTYCGYSAIQMAMACPGVHICSLEVDPMHVVIARNVIAFAGLAHMIDVWTGHSKDLIPRLSARFNLPGKEKRLTFGAVFMDQRGSRYNEDLSELERHGVLLPGAVVVADNVLKPGAPLFLWRVCMGGGYETQVVRVKEFAMPSEDWMSVSVLRRQLTPAEDPATLYRELTEPEPCKDQEPPWGRAPALLQQLEAQADRMRERATRRGRSVTFSEWSAFAENMRDQLREAGIMATLDAPEFVTACLGRSPLHSNEILEQSSS